MSFLFYRSACWNVEFSTNSIFEKKFHFFLPSWSRSRWNHWNLELSNCVLLRRTDKKTFSHVSTIDFVLNEISVKIRSTTFLYSIENLLLGKFSASRQWINKPRNRFPSIRIWLRSFIYFSLEKISLKKVKIFVLFSQFVPYQSGRGNLLKISSADLFGQVVIWDLTKVEKELTFSTKNRIELLFLFQKLKWSNIPFSTIEINLFSSFHSIEFNLSCLVLLSRLKFAWRKINNNLFCFLI